jgi:hypothetical protein
MTAPPGLAANPVFMGDPAVYKPARGWRIPKSRVEKVV